MLTTKTKTIILDGKPYMRLQGDNVVSLMNKAVEFATDSPEAQHAYLTTALVWFCLHQGVGRKRCLRNVSELYKGFHGQRLPIIGTREPPEAA